MKEFVCAALGLCGFALPAMAADLAPYYNPPPLAPMFSWTGCYLGGTVGGASAQSSVTWAPNPAGFPAFGPPIAARTAGTLTASGVTGGVEAGCNYQYTPWLVLGLEADWEYTGLSATRTGAVGVPAGPPLPFTQSLSSRWLSTVRGRAGYSAGTWLFYFTGGVAFANTSYTDSIFFPLSGATNAVTQSSTTTGWTAGGGVEWAVAANWSIKAEYLYVDLLGATLNSANSIPAAFPLATIAHTHGDLRENIGRVGLNYRF
jgi:outer membrane immunogenic protein